MAMGSVCMLTLESSREMTTAASLRRQRRVFRRGLPDSAIFSRLAVTGSLFGRFCRHPDPSSRRFYPGPGPGRFVPGPYRHGNPPDIGLDMVGFRCAGDPKP